MVDCAGVAGCNIVVQERALTMNRFLLAAVVCAASYTTNTFALEQHGTSGNGETGFFFNLDVGYQWDDNLFLTNTNESDDTRLTVTPAVRFTGKSGANTFNLGYSGEYGRYNDFDDDDFDDHRFTVDADIDINERSNLNLDAVMMRGHDPRGTGGSEGAQFQSPEPDEYDQSRFGARYEVGSAGSKFKVRLRGSITDKSYRNNELFTADREYDTTSRGGTVLWNLTGDTSLLFEVSQDEIVYDEEPQFALEILDSEETSFLVGAEWDITGRTDGFLKVGHQQKKFDAVGRDEQNGTTWDVGINYQIRSYSVLRITARQSYEETNGTGDAIDRVSYGVDWNHGWTDRLSTSVGYQTMEDTLDPSPREDEVDTVTMRAKYQFRPWMDVTLGATLSDRDSDSRAINYEREIYTLTLNLGI